jgi:branched-chain amino acid transport system ATP-binding protein
MSSDDRALIVRGATKSFGGIHAVAGVDLDVGPGEIVGLLGPNGAGKSTLINLITGLLALDAGEIRYRGHVIHDLPAHRIVKLGIGRTFQIVQPFAQMTVRQNVMVGALFGSPDRLPLSEARRRADEALDMVGLGHKKDADSRKVSTGETKRMDLARLLVMRPQCLLLDEPVAGVSQQGVDSVLDLLVSLAEEGRAIVIVEHVQRAVWQIAHRVVVLHQGRKIADGPPEQVAADESVIGAYLGERYLEVAGKQDGAGA